MGLKIARGQRAGGYCRLRRARVPGHELADDRQDQPVLRVGQHCRPRGRNGRPSTRTANGSSQLREFSWQKKDTFFERARTSLEFVQNPMSVQPVRTITEPAAIAEARREVPDGVANRSYLQRSFQQFEATLEHRLRAHLQQDADPVRRCPRSSCPRRMTMRPTAAS